MRPYFRPMLVPTLWIVPLLAMLLSLGVWQIHRLHWKLDLLEKIHVGLTAPPVPLRDVLPALDAPHFDDADYRRVVIEGRYLPDDRNYLLFFTTGSQGEPVYHILSLFLAVDEDGRDSFLIWVDRGYLPITLAAKTLPLLRARDAKTWLKVVGVIRKPAPPGWFTPPVDMAHRIVHTRDPDTLAKASGWSGVFPMFLEADATPNPGGWPRGGVTIVDLPNDHLQYAITWFGLALGLFVVYLAYHHSKGRLGLR